MKIYFVRQIWGTNCIAMRIPTTFGEIVGEKHFITTLVKIRSPKFYCDIAAGPLDGVLFI